MSVFETVLDWFGATGDIYKPDVDTTNKILQQHSFYALDDLYLGYGSLKTIESTGATEIDSVENVDKPLLVMRFSPYNQPQVDLLSEAIARCKKSDRYRENKYLVTANTEVSVTSTVVINKYIVYAGLDFNGALAIFANKLYGYPDAVAEYSKWASANNLRDYDKSYNYFGNGNINNLNPVNIGSTVDSNGYYSGDINPTTGLHVDGGLIEIGTYDTQELAIAAGNTYLISNGYPKKVGGYFLDDSFAANNVSPIIIIGFKQISSVSTTTTTTVINPLT